MVPTTDGMILLLGLLLVVVGMYVVPGLEIGAGVLCVFMGILAVSIALYRKLILKSTFLVSECRSQKMSHKPEITAAVSQISNDDEKSNSSPPG